MKGFGTPDPELNFLGHVKAKNILYFLFHGLTTTKKLVSNDLIGFETL